MDALSDRYNPDPWHHHKNAASVGSRVSVEKDTYISTGVISYIEGDIIEIELPQARLYKPGDPVKLTVYSANGFLNLISSVLAHDSGVIMVFNPPENQRLSTRRLYPRIEVRDTGRILALRTAENGPNVTNEPMGFELRNISLGGVGFSMRQKDPGFRMTMIADIEIDFQGFLPCTVEISRFHLLEDGALYVGARLLAIAPERLNILRGYVLRMQIQQRAKQRREEQSAK